MGKNRIITVQDIPITVTQADNIEDYICITDIAAAKSDNLRAADVIKNWMRNRNTLEFLGTWESIYNGDFKVVEFDHFKQQAGLHTFVLSVGEWIEKTNAIGLFVKITAVAENRCGCRLFSQFSNCSFFRNNSYNFRKPIAIS